MPTRTTPSSEPASRQRELWGTERFWHFAHHEHEGAFDMVSIFVVDIGSRHLDLSDWQREWSVLSQTFPVLSCRVASDDGEARIQDEAVRAQEMVFSGPLLQDDQQRIDYCLLHRSFDNLSLTVFAPSPTEKEIVHLAITNPHALGDAQGVFSIGKSLIERVTSPVQAAIQPTTTVHGRPSSSTLSAAKVEDLGLKDMFEIARKGSSIGLAILPKELTLDPPSLVFGEWRKVYTFTPSQTDALIRFCKARSLTVSTWLQASIFHALIHVLEDVGVGEREAQTFTVAAMPFSHPTGKAGATSTIFAPISVQVKSGQDVEDTAKAVAESFALARRFTVDVQDDYVKTLLKLFSSIRPETSVPTFSSLGRLETVEGLRRYHVAARNNLPSTGIHAWTLNGQLSLTFSWAPARFDREQVENFWSTWIGAIKRAVA